MKIEVRYDQGRIILPPNVRLRDDVTTFTLEIPNGVIAAPIYETADPALKQAHAMLGLDYSYESSGKTEKELLTEALIEKYGS
ncbi:MAG: hypothetical protein PHW74_12120 [Desulfobacca sp.]|nr:hypothetical protein [Desulfobacca sp.]